MINKKIQYNKTVRFLYDLQFLGIKFGLKNIQSLLDHLGNPENHFPSIHIAGTNGKGSTAAMIASVLAASGYKTGLYTSPHLTDFSERIRINGVKISWDEIVSYTKSLRNEIIKRKATFFEATTAIAFRYFADKKIDIAVVETGLGGRWDATNVLSPLVSIITNIDIEHEHYLGKTYKSIAYEKGGIIKPFTSCITATDNTKALSIIRTISGSNQSPLIHIKDQTTARIRNSTISGLNADLKTKNHTYQNLEISLAGNFQIENALISLLALEHCKENEKFSLISNNTIRRGFSTIQFLSGLKGRCEVISIKPLVIGDVAHNPYAIKSLVQSLQQLVGRKFFVVFGVMQDKKYKSMIENLYPITRRVIAVQPKGTRSLNKFVVQEEFQNLGLQCAVAKNCREGYKLALGEKRQNEPILITGSHYVLSEIFEKNE
jgi:dihydrofolate synthase / folylpolyglutamate synthase